ncbi:MAG: hypothetical protein Q9184_004535 [Pyrenodesmia sp. 2 TL-2023]
MHELQGHEETIGEKRPHGVDHGGKAGRKNSQDRRTATENYEGELEPTVLIIGANQGGLTSAARLCQLEIPTLIIDKNSRVGDNWRNRDHQLVLHDPVWYDHFPYVQFPSHWPVFTLKNKLAEWLESYARLMELNLWTSTLLTCAKWDNEKRQRTVTLQHRRADGTTEIRTLHSHHVIQAMGHSGEIKMPSIKGMDGFKGHDIAQDFYEHGYDVTIVQCSYTYVRPSKNGLDVLLGGLYEEGGPETEDVNLMFMSIPNAMLKRMHQDATAEITKRDEAMLKALTEAGFKLDDGPDDAGFFMKYF